MPTQRHLGRRGEPADMPGIRFAHQERRFRQVVLGGDTLHLLVGQPLLKAIDDRRIAAEGAVAEGIDLVERQGHGGFLDNWNGWTQQPTRGRGAAP
ncbi:hypothetical protein D3C77_619820 [compost metagenome]